MSDTIDSTYGQAKATDAHDDIAQVNLNKNAPAFDLDQDGASKEFKASAIKAENAEHNMGVLEAVRAYPMASFWAFVMSFTIVSCLFPFPLNLSFDQESLLTLYLGSGVLLCLPRRQFCRPACVRERLWCTRLKRSICYRDQVAVCASSFRAARCDYRCIARWPPY